MYITFDLWGARFFSRHAPPPYADVSFDCRALKDKIDNLGYCHSGNRPEVIRGITRQPGFREWLANAKRQISAKMLEMFEQGKTEIIIGAVCKSGKHRSVACANILRFCLTGEALCNVNSASHIDEGMARMPMR